MKTLKQIRKHYKAYQTKKAREKCDSLISEYTISSAKLRATHSLAKVKSTHTGSADQINRVADQCIFEASELNETFLNAWNRIRGKYPDADIDWNEFFEKLKW